MNCRTFSQNPRTRGKAITIADEYFPQCGESPDTSVVRQGTTVAEAEIYIRYLNNITGHKYLVQNKQEIKEKAF